MCFDAKFSAFLYPVCASMFVDTHFCVYMHMYICKYAPVPPLKFHVNSFCVRIEGRRKCQSFAIQFLPLFQLMRMRVKLQ